MSAIIWPLKDHSRFVGKLTVQSERSYLVTNLCHWVMEDTAGHGTFPVVSGLLGMGVLLLYIMSVGLEQHLRATLFTSRSLLNLIGCWHHMQIWIPPSLLQRGYWQHKVFLKRACRKHEYSLFAIVFDATIDAERKASHMYIYEASVARLWR
ncbi:hypothetical protein Nepgr_012421 [Nepenthes gracilis]|uniref:Uncharacterized protein n=1 Tax=Nepenthes gracilis TaxID=150966 RepID=A0AAD3SFS1_NEPGR|nr:hypothetical protein Nepgr_012421 [Nepenthes gracilis]